MGGRAFVSVPQRGHRRRLVLVTHPCLHPRAHAEPQLQGWRLGPGGCVQALKGWPEGGVQPRTSLREHLLSLPVAGGHGGGGGADLCFRERIQESDVAEERGQAAGHGARGGH